ncbi:MAG: hypothetical protein IJR89_05805 [Clostridia bacterium]|nr:hypothetical protein [Clostridia bacterium]
MKAKVCCFFGHRTIPESNELKERLSAVIERLITSEKVDTFLFGSKSRFNDLCHELVTKSKERHPHVRRIYVRAEYPLISDAYKAYLLKDYEDTYYPERMIGAGKAAYVERNREMIRNSDCCVVYFKEGSAPAGRRSGTKIALEYAIRQGKRVIRL